MIPITADKINFDNATPVISGAQKFVIPVPAFNGGGEPLVFPEGEKAGQPIADWQGNPIGDKGLVFFNEKDKSYQAVKGDGTGVVIINLVNEEKAAKLTAKVNEFGGDPSTLSLDQVKQVLATAKEEGLGDMYNSDKGFIAKKMSTVGQGSGVEAYGLHKRDDRDICQAVFIPGSGEFQGPAATPQKFENGAVILKQGDSVRLIQPDAFENSYKHADGKDIKVDSLAKQSNPLGEVIKSAGQWQAAGKELDASGAKTPAPPTKSAGQGQSK